MTFRDVAFRNFKANMRKYTSYLLCSSFAIMMFFIYSTLLFNDSLMHGSDKDMATMVFSISLMTIALFSVIFINYAHTAFIKSRYREFGLYLTLGMTKRDVRRIIIIENCIIIIASSLAGIGTGVVFSRLFQLVVVKMLGLEGIPYSLDYKSFVLTLTVFVAIFLLVIVFSIISTRKLEISELLKESRKPGKRTGSGLPAGILGIALLAAALVMVYFIATSKTLKSNVFMIGLFTLTGFSGIYLTISSLGGFIQALMKRNSGLYYRNMLFITGTNRKFSQNKRVLFILSILSAMIVFFMASPFSLYSLSESIAETSQMNHLEFAEFPGINNISPDELEKIVSSGSTPVTGRHEAEFIQLSFKSSDRYDLLQRKPVISESTYNDYFKTEVSVPEGQAINVIIAWEPGYHGIEPSSTIMLGDGVSNYSFVVKDSLHTDHMKWISGGDVYPASSGLIINDADYTRIKSGLTSGNIGKLISFSFKNWLVSEPVVKKLEEALNKSNLGNKQASSPFKTASTVESYNGLKQAYSLFVFIMSFLGLLFFISAGSVLYFKQYTELAADKAKFCRLFKIGISRAEIRKVISKELMLTFFTPLVLGSIMGYAFIFLVTHMVGGEGIIKEFMLNSTKVVVVYFIFQTAFYLITRRKYTNELIAVS